MQNEYIIKRKAIKTVAKELQSGHGVLFTQNQSPEESFEKQYYIPYTLNI
jgi:hypothetical protein